MSNKHYCKNCKWNGKLPFFLHCFGWKWCENNNKYSGQSFGAIKKQQLNSNGDCIYYKPKLHIKLLKWLKCLN